MSQDHCPSALTPRPLLATTSASPPCTPTSSTATTDSAPQHGLEPLVRDWSVPARPKPGRKPAQDTPPTKRKEQNRAAQRAFRERRAARVSELEDVLEHTKRGYEERIKTLEAVWSTEKDNLQREMYMWRARCEEHEKTNARDQAEITYLRRQAEQAAHFRWSQGSSTASSYTGSLQSSVGFSMTSKPSLDQQISPTSLRAPPYLPLPTPNPDPPSLSLINTQNIEKTVSSLPDPKQDPAPVTNSQAMLPLRQTPHSRVKTDHDTYKPADTDSMEIDFTTTRKKPAVSSISAILRDQNEDQTINEDIQEVGDCGFCSDNTPCVCREAALASADGSHDRMTKDARNSAGVSMTSATTKPQPVEPSPGSCASCLNDPLRRRFCINLSAYSSTPTNFQGHQPPPPLPQRGTAHPHDGRITCADAYSRLQQEIPDFPRRVDDRNLYRQLRPSPAAPERECGSCSSKGCAAYELDAANVLAAIASSSGGKYRAGAG